MLSCDSLLALALERGLPPGKLRGAVREYAHVAALKCLFQRKSAAGLVFLGGAALRLGWDLPRFSEDLDFDAEAFSAREWKELLEETAGGLARMGFDVRHRSAEKGSLLEGDLRFENILQAYGVTRNPGEKLKIKVEANRPRYPISARPRVISAYGEMLPAPFADPGLMAGEKILCLLSRELGRDVYDLFFMAGKKWVPDPRVLASKGIQGPARAILDRVSGWGPARLSRMAQRLEPFLFEPEQARLVGDAARLLPGALEYLGCAP